MKILFFGSTPDSVIVLESLEGVVAVVTQPAKPVGREKILTPTQVELWAKKHNLPVLSFATHPDKPWLYEHEQQVIDTLQPFKADLIISASYGVKIPWDTIKSTPYGGINIHPSLLPRWRGGDPVPWAILSGDHQIGVTVQTLGEQFDRGTYLSQKKIPILPNDTSAPLRSKLFRIGAEALAALLPDFIAHYPPKQKKQKDQKQPYARRLKRDDGFEPWEQLLAPQEAERINRKFRALHPWPGLWTMFGGKRLKILEFRHEPLTVQREGKNPVSWEQFKKTFAL